MAVVTRQGLLDELVEQAVAAGREPTAHDAAEVLLTDLLACVLGADAGGAPRDWSGDGTTGLAAAVASRAHARDQDDVHWPTMVHPGSVVWPVVLAVGVEVRATGADVAAAARAGYHAMRSLSLVLGPVHARSWHATATCGSLGSALPAAMLLGLDTNERRWASAHAIAMAGGVGQAVLERSGTTVFHRVAAAALGIQAARLGHARVRASERVLEGELGVLALLAPEAATDGSAPAVGDALGSTSVRVFPVNGFAQAAVALAAELRREAQSEVSELVVEVSEAAAGATTGAVGGDWWDLRSAVASAWTTGDPFLLGPSEESERLRERIRVVARPGPSRTTRMTAQTPGGAVHGELDAPPGASLDDPALAALLDRKWGLLVGPTRGGAAAARNVARAVLGSGPRDADLRALLSAYHATHP